MEFNIDNISCIKSIPNNMKHLLICCHGITSNKLSILKITDSLVQNNVGVISFNFPGHENLDEFSLNNCLKYLDRVYEYASKTYINTKISLLGSSFGGYVILNKVMQENPYYKVLLKYPAINFINDVKRKTGLDDSFFNDTDKLEFNNLMISKNTYLEFKNNNVFENFNKIKDNIYIIHGNNDQAVLIEDIIKFSNKYNIQLVVVDGGRHGLRDKTKEVVDFIIEKLGE